MVGSRGKISPFAVADVLPLSLAIDADGWAEEKSVISVGEFTAAPAVSRVVGREDGAAGVGISLSTKEESCRGRRWLKW